MQKLAPEDGQVETELRLFLNTPQFERQSCGDREGVRDRVELGVEPHVARIRVRAGLVVKVKTPYVVSEIAPHALGVLSLALGLRPGEDIAVNLVRVRPRARLEHARPLIRVVAQHPPRKYD